MSNIRVKLENNFLAILTVLCWPSSDIIMLLRRFPLLLKSVLYFHCIHYYRIFFLIFACIHKTTMIIYSMMITCVFLLAVESLKFALGKFITNYYVIYCIIIVLIVVYYPEGWMKDERWMKDEWRIIWVSNFLSHRIEWKWVNTFSLRLLGTIHVRWKAM